MVSVEASCHQGHPKYFGQGRQCVANSYAAMIHHFQRKKASTWTQEDLDSIVRESDDMYNHLKENGQKEDFLLLSDLPYLEVTECLAGSVFNTKQITPFVSLY